MLARPKSVFYILNVKLELMRRWKLLAMRNGTQLSRTLKRANRGTIEFYWIPAHSPSRYIKHGKLRYNYGCLPQTWEDPKHTGKVEGLTIGYPGDNDPVDVVELGTRIAKRGEVVQVIPGTTLRIVALSLCLGQNCRSSTAHRWRRNRLEASCHRYHWS